MKVNASRRKATEERSLERLTAVSRALTYAHSLDEVLEITVDTARDLLDAPRVVLMLQGEEDDLLRIRAARGVEDEIVERFREPLDETLVSRLSSIFGSEARNRFLGVPLVVRGRVTGLLAVLRRQESRETRDEWLLSALADQASVALEDARREATRSGLRARLRKAEEQDERLEQALRTMGHDMGGPLNALRGYVDMLQAEMYGPLSESQQQVLQRVDSITGHLDSLVSNALEMSRLQAGRLTVTREPVPVGEVVADALEIVGLRAEEMGVNLRVDVAPDLVARADDSRLRQVIIQILDNALRHAPAKSEVRVTAAREPAPDDRVVIRVADQGPGIEDADAESIFEPFQRLEETTSGSGLGLAIARMITDLMEGELTLEDDGSPGATFAVRLHAE